MQGIGEIMRRFLFALLLLAPPCFAVTDNPDGSVTFTREEAQNLLENFQKITNDSEQYEVDRATALGVLKKMQDEIDRLTNGKCI